MQNKQTTKIIIDKTKLETLVRLGCSKEAIIDKIICNKFVSQKDELIDCLLESLTDIKHFKNWGGKRYTSKKNNQLEKHLDNQVESQDEHQDDCQDESQDDCQVVDKDIDKDKDIDIDKDNILKNRKDNLICFGELQKVKLTQEQYDLLLSKYGNKLSDAIEKLDTWLATTTKKVKSGSHYAYFKSNSWVWDKDKNIGYSEKKRKMTSSEVTEHNRQFLIDKYGIEVFDD